MNDNGRKTFILQVDLLQKMLPLSDNKLIYCTNGYGPTFGEWDIYISDNCNTVHSHTSQFPQNYNIDGPNKYTNGQAAFTAMSGATANYNFKVI